MRVGVLAKCSLLVRDKARANTVLHFIFCIIDLPESFMLCVKWCRGESY